MKVGESQTVSACCEAEKMLSAGGLAGSLQPFRSRCEDLRHDALQLVMQDFGKVQFFGGVIMCNLD
jgi:hypothetical protein